MGTIQRQLNDLIAGQRELRERMEEVESVRLGRRRQPTVAATPNVDMSEVNKNLDMVLESQQAMIALLQTVVGHVKEQTEKYNSILDSLYKYIQSLWQFVELDK